MNFQIWLREGKNYSTPTFGEFISLLLKFQSSVVFLSTPFGISSPKQAKGAIL